MDADAEHAFDFMTMAVRRLCRSVMELQPHVFNPSWETTMKLQIIVCVTRRYINAITVDLQQVGYTDDEYTMHIAEATLRRMTRGQDHRSLQIEQDLAAAIHWRLCAWFRHMFRNEMHATSTKMGDGSIGEWIIV